MPTWCLTSINLLSLCSATNYEVGAIPISMFIDKETGGLRGWGTCLRLINESQNF